MVILTNEIDESDGIAPYIRAQIPERKIIGRVEKYTPRVSRSLIFCEGN